MRRAGVPARLKAVQRSRTQGLGTDRDDRSDAKWTTERSAGSSEAERDALREHAVEGVDGRVVVGEIVEEAGVDENLCRRPGDPFDLVVWLRLDNEKAAVVVDRDDVDFVTEAGHDSSVAYARPPRIRASNMLQRFVELALQSTEEFRSDRGRWMRDHGLALQDSIRGGETRTHRSVNAALTTSESWKDSFVVEDAFQVCVDRRPVRRNEFRRPIRRPSRIEAADSLVGRVTSYTEGSVDLVDVEHR